MHGGIRRGVQRRRRCNRRIRVGLGDDRLAPWHASVHDHSDQVHPAKARNCHQAVVHGAGYRVRRRCLAVRRTDDRPCGDYRHGQHRRRGDRPVLWRPGRHLLDVDHRYLWHRDQVRRDLHLRQVPRQGPSRRDARRCHVRARAWLQAQEARQGPGGALRAVRVHRVVWHRGVGPVELPSPASSPPTSPSTAPSSSSGPTR